ncbi:MAG TPA: tail fiber domain-containing protein, partial [Ferruginibacter sp.]|nr:tail fiber domain-containing protein [Ferruginibacter sp.]
TAIGTGANVQPDGVTNSTAVGYDAVVTGSNIMAFGNENVLGWGFGAGYPTSQHVLVVGTTTSAIPNGNGAYLTAGGDWTNTSDRNLKEDFSTLDSKDVLSRINKLSITKWKYKGTSEYHVGPMAQDFYSSFNLGTDNTHISTIDPAGVALIAIQELSAENNSLQNANTQQEQQIQQVQQTNNNLQQQLNDLKTTIGQMQTAMSECCNSYSSNMVSAAQKPVVLNASDLPTLQQNTPNPYTGETVIGYYLPQSTTNAEIIVTDLSGNVIKSISLNGTGNGQIIFSAGALSSGSYFYTLLDNGQKIDTKEMIIAK